MANQPIHAQNPSTDIVTLVGGVPKTTSLIVAEKFCKLHKNVVRAIENIECSENFRRLNFEPTFREVPGPKNSVRQERIYEMTRDGFTFLAMGFTGKEAAQWKEAYIEAFNQLEAALTGQQAQPQPAPALPPKRPIRTRDDLSFTRRDLCRQSMYAQLPTLGPQPPHVIGSLRRQPGFGALAESYLQSHGHFRAERDLAVDQLGHGLARHVQMPSGFGKAQTQGLQPQIGQNFAGVRRVEQAHDASSVVVQIIDDVHVAILETKDDAPVGLDRHRPEPGAVAFQPVQFQCRGVQIGQGAGIVQQRQNQPQALGVDGLNARLAAGGEEPFQPLVRETLYHALSVTQWVTSDKLDARASSVVSYARSLDASRAGFGHPELQERKWRSHRGAFFMRVSQFMAGRAGVSQGTPVLLRRLTNPVRSVAYSFGHEWRRLHPCKLQEVRHV